MIMQKFRMTMQNGPEGGFVLQAKGNFKADFRMIMQKFRTVMRNASRICKLLLLHFLFCTIVRNVHFIIKLQISL